MKFESMWQSAAPYLAAVLAVLLALCLVVVLIVSVDNHKLTQQQITQTQNFHTKNLVLQNQILTLTQEVRDAQIANKGTLTAINTLEQQVATVIEGLPAADKELAQEAVGLEAQIESLCQAVGATCSAALPVIAPPT